MPNTLRATTIDALRALALTVGRDCRWPRGIGGVAGGAPREQQGGLTCAAAVAFDHDGEIYQTLAWLRVQPAAGGEPLVKGGVPG